MSSYNNDEDILLLATLCGATVAVKAIAEDLETYKRKKETKKREFGQGNGFLNHQMKEPTMAF